MSNPFPLTRDMSDVKPVHPEEVPPHGIPESFAEFLERTRRYRYLTQPRQTARYARGLDSKPEDFA